MKFATPVITLIAATATGAVAFVPNTSYCYKAKTSLASYLDDIGGASAPKPGNSGIASYLDSVPTSSARASGAGIGNYLDSVNQACDGAQPTTDCADAITDYMGALSSGDAPASSALEGAQTIGNYLDALVATDRQGGAGIQSYLETVATVPERVGGAGIASYLQTVPTTSTVQSAPAVKSYLDALTSGNTEAPTGPAVQEYLSNVASGATAAPTSGGGISSYLDVLPAANVRFGGGGIASHLSSMPQSSTQLSGAGIAGYLDNVATNPVRAAGAGIGNYLESVTEACDAVQPDSTGCAEAISDYLGALSGGNAPAESSNSAAQSIGGYLDHLASGSHLSGGAGIPDYLSSVPISSAVQSSASAVKSYLDVMSTGSTEAPTAPVVQEYLSDVSSGAASVPTSGAGIASYLTAMNSVNILSGGAGIQSHVNTLASGSQLSGAGISSFLDSVGGASNAPVTDAPAIVASTPTAFSDPSTKIDTQISHDGLQTTITITSTTTVVLDDAQ